MPFYTGESETILCIQRNCIYKTLRVSGGNSKTDYLPSLRVKYNLVFHSLSKFAVKLNCWIALGSTSRACCLIKSIIIIL